MPLVTKKYKRLDGKVEMWERSSYNDKDKRYYLRDTATGQIPFQSNSMAEINREYNKY